MSNDAATYGPEQTGMPEVFADSALAMFVAANSTASGQPEMQFVIANG
jgi:hypothetical protein